MIELTACMVAGAVCASFIEHLFGVNFVDKAVGYFRSAEAEVTAAERKVSAATEALKNAVQRVTKKL